MSPQFPGAPKGIYSFLLEPGGGGIAGGVTKEVTLTLVRLENAISRSYGFEQTCKLLLIKYQQEQSTRSKESQKGQRSSTSEEYLDLRSECLVS